LICNKQQTEISLLSFLFHFIFSFLIKDGLQCKKILTQATKTNYCEISHERGNRAERPGALLFNVGCNEQCFLQDPEKCLAQIHLSFSKKHKKCTL